MFIEIVPRCSRRLIHSDSQDNVPSQPVRFLARALFVEAYKHGLRIRKRHTMKTVLKITSLLWLALGCNIPLYSADLVIPLPGPVSQKKVTFQCDEHGKAMGLPSGPFTVTYLNSDNNSLAVLPLNGRPLIFSGVLSADGARYAASRFVWWDVGARGVHLYSDSYPNKEQTACHVAH